MPPRELFGLIQDRDCAGHIPTGKPQAGDKHSVRNEGVDTFYLPRQLQALLRVQLGSIQIVPFVVDTRQPRCASDAIVRGG